MSTPNVTTTTKARRKAYAFYAANFVVEKEFSKILNNSNMEKLPTAEEFLNTEEYYSVSNDFDTQKAMIEFAKLHVEAALKAAAEKAEITYISKWSDDKCVDSKSILNSYSLENIK